LAKKSRAIVIPDLISIPLFRILKRDVGVIPKDMTNKYGLAGLPWPGKADHGIKLGRFFELRFEMTGDH
jgi:hypothetical protein